jgi:L-2-hydroxyglutarate oxidase LhgO
MRHFLAHARSGGADVAFLTEFLGAVVTGSGFSATLKGADGERTEIAVRKIINAAGLGCDRVAASCGIDIDAAGYRLHPNRGHYFRVSPGKSQLVHRLVYPVPHPHLTGVGIHITIDRAGSVRLGPDTEYVTGPSDTWYRFDETRRDEFYRAASRYFPLLDPEDLSPDQIGVRPKLQRPGEPLRDFIIREETERGLPGLVNLIGIESPGLTCSPVIAEEVMTFIS